MFTTHPFPRRRTVALAASAAALAVCSTAVTVTAQSAHAANSPRRAAAPAAAVHTAAAAQVRVVPDIGYTITRGHRDYVGSYRTLGKNPVRLWCPNPYSTSPTYVAMGSSSSLEIYNSRGKVVRVPAVTQARLSYLLTNYGSLGGLRGTAAKQHRAAALSQAINTFLGNSSDVKRRAGNVPASVRTQTKSLITAATNYAGPYRLSFGAHPALAVGQSHGSTVALIAHSGKAVPGQRFTLAASGGSVSRAVTADRRGVARFTYAASSAGWVKVTARATTAGQSLVASGLHRGFQRLIGAGARGTAAANFAVHKAIKGASVSYACTSTCNGKPVETVTQCTDAGTAATMISVYDGTRAVSTKTLPRSSKRACLAQRVTVPDSHTLKVTIRYNVGGKWTSPIAVGAVTIDCPPPPAVQVTQSCACVTGVVTATLRNTTTYAQAIVVNGSMSTVQNGKTTSTVVKPGQTLALSYAYSATQKPFTLAVNGAAQRRTGAHPWNVGTTTLVSIGS